MKNYTYFSYHTDGNSTITEVERGPSPKSARLQVADCVVTGDGIGVNDQKSWYVKSWAEVGKTRLYEVDRNGEEMTSDLTYSSVEEKDKMPNYSGFLPGLIFLICCFWIYFSNKTHMRALFTVFSVLLSTTFSPTGIFAQQLEIEGKIVVGDDIDAPVAGAIRYVSGKFEGFNGTRWVSLSNCVDTQYYAISPTAFVPESNSSNWSIMGQGAYASSGMEYISAPVNLPHNVKITSITFYYYDTSPNDLEMSLYTPSNSGIFLIASHTTSGSSPGIQMKSILTDFNTDNSEFSIHVEVRPKTGDVWDGFDTQVYNIFLSYVCL